jgi:hypothetical protein
MGFVRSVLNCFAAPVPSCFFALRPAPRSINPQPSTINHQLGSWGWSLKRISTRPDIERCWGMPSHSKDTLEGGTIVWPDASLEKIDAEYEEFIIRVQEEVGGRKVVRCLGYIGFQMVGFWDEVIIERAIFHPNHAFTRACERRLKSLPETGAKTRAATGNKLLEITFIDGCALWICASQFRCDQG